MLDLRQFEGSATIHRREPTIGELAKLPLPHPLAVEILREFAGLHLVPFGVDTNAEFDVKFEIEEAIGYQRELMLLRSIPKRDLYPVASSDNASGILMIASSGEVFGLSVNSLDVYFLGSLADAIWTMLKGRPMQPVLPIRDYPQDHNVHTYLPSDAKVMWIDTDRWISDTKAE
jgi:hypothetical protein